MSEPEDLVAAVRRLAIAEHVLVALDFDGTLAPEVDDPEAARATPEAHAALLAVIAAPRTTLALVSGRAVASLEQVSALPDAALLVGSHGVEERVDGTVRLAFDDAERHRLAALLDTLETVAARAHGAWVEKKPAGFALHTRLVAPDAAVATQQAARDEVAATVGDDLTVRAGKNVLEFSVRTTTKGDAVRALRERSGATAVLFAGDDVTDEDGFAALGAGDVGVKVGPGETAAEFRAEGPAELAAALTELARTRGASGV